MASQNLFPSIGTVAQQADDSVDQITVSDENGTHPKEDDDRVVEEVESLCMNCEEQVGTQLSSCKLLTQECKAIIGSYATPLNLYPIFQRGYCDVFPLRTLWLFQ